MIKRRSLLLAAPALILARPALSFWQSRDSNYNISTPSGGGGGGGAPTTFDASSVGTGIALTNGNLTATKSGVNFYGQARSVASHSTGKYYWEITITNTASDGTQAVGIGTSSTPVYTGGASFPGDDTNSGATFDNNDGFFVNGASVGQCLPAAYTISDTVGVALDAGGKLIWVRRFSSSVASNWNNNGTADPASGSGGFSIAAITGPYYAYIWLTDAILSYTANFGASAFAMSSPSGFGNL